MKRRSYLKTITLGSILPLANPGYGFIKKSGQLFQGPLSVHFKSEWQFWPDMKWAGPQYWGNRLQDWLVQDGKLINDITGFNRSLHLLTLQNAKPKANLLLTVKIHRLNAALDNFTEGCLGFLVGAKGPFDDFRSAAVFGEGFVVGVTPGGKLQIGNQYLETGLRAIPEYFQLTFQTETTTTGIQGTVTILNLENNQVLFKADSLQLNDLDLSGNFALLSSFGKNMGTDQDEAAASFEDWEITSPELYQNQENLFGPVCFAQYTLHRKKLKLTAQLAPIEAITGHKIMLQFEKEDSWETAEETRINHPGRAVHFSIANWEKTADTPYRILVEIPVRDGVHSYSYEGTIAREPADRDELKVAVFSCNAHYGFPDADIPASLQKLEYDLSVFLGDQFYEITGGFRAQFTGDFDKQCLDYLRKWMMFGWSYREIFKHKPCAIIPDDHDVYHGNVWGEGGKLADTSSGFSSAAQDTGGYKMSPQWVNMVQFTQTSHLPDAFDPTPVKNNIGVYYTHWNYAGLSFAILEDRKFKSAPQNVLPKEADVFNGFIRNPDFDIKKHKNTKAELLGARQEDFLEAWVRDWSHGAEMKAVFSQTNFATVATLPEGATGDDIVPSLKIPNRGVYITGDAPTVDMDSNGWPAAKRDKAIQIISKGMAFHIAGDQHLASFIQYGVDDYEEGSFAFAGPALNNLWPRRFWPPVPHVNHTIQNPAYTGNHTDGFGNKFTLHAVANPYDRKREPKILYDRANGFGRVIFNKKERSIRTECYERFKEVDAVDAQYPGWPVVISQEDNLLKNAAFYLPHIHFTGYQQLPLLKIYENEELIYVLRVPQTNYQPRTRKPAKYSLVVEDLDTGVIKTLGLHRAQPLEKQNKVLQA